MAVCGVVPVSAIMRVVPVGTHRRCRTNDVMLSACQGFSPVSDICREKQVVEDRLLFVIDHLPIAIGHRLPAAYCKRKKTQ